MGLGLMGPSCRRVHSAALALGLRILTGVESSVEKRFVRSLSLCAISDGTKFLHSIRRQWRQVSFSRRSAFMVSAEISSEPLDYRKFLL